jgi:hypothetical protein
MLKRDEPREHRGGFAESCVPMRVITPKGEAGRMVLEDDMGGRHELRGDWTGDLLPMEKACVDAAKAKLEAAKAASKAALLQQGELDLADESVTPAERHAFCTGDGHQFFVSARLPAALTSALTSTPLEPCVPLLLCRSSHDVVIGKDARGVYFRLEGAWADLTYQSAGECAASLAIHPRADVFVAYHQGKESIPYYRIVGD